MVVLSLVGGVEIVLAAKVGKGALLAELYGLAVDGDG